jgi:putative hydrolase of the HAD superfamily
MIDTVIFDIGGVLVNLTWENMYNSFGFSSSVMQRVANATVHSGEWKEYDRGVLTDKEILKRFISHDPELADEITLSQKNIHGILSRRDSAIPWIKAVKDGGYRTLYLSNFSEKALNDCSDAMDFLPYLDGGVFSYRVQLIKPDDSIYLYIIYKYSLEPEKCVFIDDTEENLTAARRFGFNTVHYENRAQADEELSALGVRF